MQTKEVRLDKYSRKNNALTKSKHKLIFHVIDFEEIRNKYWIEYYGVYWLYATMNWSEATPNASWYYCKSDLCSINMKKIKEFWYCEDSWSCFWYETDDIINQWHLCYLLSDSKFSDFVKHINNPKETMVKNYEGFKFHKVNKMFHDAVDRFELP